jgi:hypothetical protein
VLLLDEGSHSVRIRAFGWEDASAAVYVRRNRTQVLDVVLSPASLTLRLVRESRRRFNPANPGSLGTTTLVFEVSAPGRGSFLVLDPNGQMLFRRELGPFTSWAQSVAWDGRDQSGGILPDGSYTMRIEAVSSGRTAGEAASAELEVVLDSSVNIIPFRISAAAPGLSWAPGAELNPSRSWQVEGTMLFGKPFREEAWRSLPFASALSIIPFERLEIGAVVTVTPRIEGKAPLSQGLSFKLGILRAGGWTGSSPLPLNLALGLRYGFLDEGELTPFGLPSGPELFLPFSVELIRIFAPNETANPVPLRSRPGTSVSLLFVPALWWPGEHGRPEDGVPRGVVSGGLEFRRSPLSAALSVRTESAFGGPFFQKIMAGGEIKFFPSLMVFSLSGGAWFESSRRGFYGGIGIGIIN